jgi:DNA polymerase-3 subunit gamma/tau
MSYKVFARRFRPKTFDEVLGQEHVVETLQRAIEKNTVAHAYIFAGTRGVGKTSMARILARALNCDQGPTSTPCGECSSCRSLVEGNNFDVVEIDGASNNSVNDIRELRDSVSYSTYEGMYKIYVIDEVHMLSREAFNAFLKTLEEPPDRVVFIMATTEPHKIPDTIHSRCQRFDFKSLSLDTLVRNLEKICGAENLDFDQSALELIATRAQGSVRDSLSLFEQALAFCGDRVDLKNTEKALGLITEDVYNQVLSYISQEKPRECVEALKECLNQGYDLKEFILGFMEYLRRVLFNFVEDREYGYADFREGDILRFIELLRQCELDMNRSSLPRFQVELLLIKMCRLDKMIALEELFSRVGEENMGEKKSPEPVVSEYTQLSAPALEERDTEPVIQEFPKNQDEASHAASGEESVSDDRKSRPGSRYNSTDKKAAAEFWHSFQDFLCEKRPVLGSWMVLGRVVEFDRDSIDIRFSPMHTFQQKELSNPKTRELIEELLYDFSRTRLTLHITAAADDDETADSVEEPKVSPSPSVSPDKPLHKHESYISDEIKREPVIEDVIEVFKGTVI